MKLLEKIIDNDNAIFASIHKNNYIKEDFTNQHPFDRMDQNDKKDTENLHKSLSKHYDLEKNMVHRSHLVEYSDDSSGVNNYLWKSHKKEKMDSDEKSFKHEVPKLDEALSIHKTPHDMHVYSGMQYDPRSRMKTTKSGTSGFKHPAYLSTSLMKGKALGFSDLKKDNEMHVLKIHVPKGSKGAYIGSHSANPSEREFVIPRGAALKYHKTETEDVPDHPLYKGIKIHTHEVSLL